jgi:6-phosphofructokinase 1
LTTLYSNKVLS